MSQIADIALNDSGAVARTFAAAIKDGLMAKYIYNNGSAMSLRPFVLLKMREEDTNKNVSRKTTVQVVHPYTETVDSVEVTRYASARLEFTTPESASATVLADLMAFADNILANSQITDTVKDASFPL